MHNKTRKLRGSVHNKTRKDRKKHKWTFLSEAEFNKLISKYL